MALSGGSSSFQRPKGVHTILSAKAPPGPYIYTYLKGNTWPDA
jgi:hypothetical protein